MTNDTTTPPTRAERLAALREERQHRVTRTTRFERFLAQADREIASRDTIAATPFNQSDPESARATTWKGE
jgi:hypothetical protein